jgi:hypothetical protein
MSDEANQKDATDAFGGDPMTPNEVLLARIAAVIKGGKKDDQVTRWAAAFAAVCTDPIDTAPRVSVEDYLATPPGARLHLASPFHARGTLAKVAAAVTSGKKDEDATAWADTVQGISEGETES